MDNPAGKLFNFQINYNKSRSGVVDPLYNGNIAETYWKTSNDNTMRRYAYTYDALNRITSGKFNGGGQTDRYTVEDIAYDKNGNITKLTRNGAINANATSFGLMDKLSYVYHNGGNFLVKVTETGNKTYGFKDGSNTDNDYARDANGNTTRDRNKGITGITYNHLNLPTQVSFGSNKIAYIYDASGVKLKKEVTQGSSVTNTEYAGKYIYENGQLQFFSHPEGYVTKENNTYKYVYQYKDHLDNVRLSYTNTGTISAPQLEIIEENNYYPFGLKQKGYNGQTSSLGNDVAQRWKFGSKELDESLGLEMYDFGARNYTPDIGRWMNIDPLADTYISLSPYNYVSNNPIYFVDPDGRRIDISTIYKKDKEGNDILDKNGNRILVGINISVTGKILNKSSKSFTDKQLSSFTSRLSKSIKSSFSSANEKGFTVNVSTDITVASDENPITETDYVFTIVDGGKIPDADRPGKFRSRFTVGYAPFGELGIYFNAGIINDTDVPATTGIYANTGKTNSGGATLERTGAHELGHSANLPHVSRGTMDSNLMHQSRRPNAGTKLTKAQILKMKEDYNKGLLNKGRQDYRYRNKPIGPRKADGSF
ncbi:RHS repeat-associated core domain-containing protein [Sinomicrobium sp. M5D2P17]